MTTRDPASDTAASGQQGPSLDALIREDQLASLRALNEAKLLEDQRYLDLKAQGRL